MEKAPMYETPLAYGYAENGLLHANLNWQMMEQVHYSNTIGKDLVNFAFLEHDAFYRTMLEISEVCHRLLEQQPNRGVIADVLLEKYRPLFRHNLYLSVYLMSLPDYLLTRTLDRRVFPGTSAEEQHLIQAAENAALHSEALLNIVDLIYDVFCAKRELAEAALRVLYENAEEDSLTPLERYYRQEQEDPEFGRLLHSTFTTRLGTRGRDDKTVLQLTVLGTVDDLLRYELFLLVTQGKRYKFCKNCGKPFIPTKRADTLYCDRIMPGADKPCRAIGANLALKKKVDGDPVLTMYRRAYQRLHKRVEQGYMEDAAFVAWCDEAKRKRDQCLAGKLSEENFADWIHATSRQR